MQDQVLVLGAPIFGHCSDSPYWAPTGYEQLFADIRAQSVDDLDLVNNQWEEYWGLAVSLKKAGRQFTILRPEGIQIEEEIVDHLERLGVEWTKVRSGLGESNKLAVFPRDLALYLPDGETVLVNSEELPHFCATRRDGLRIRRSKYGEGGKSLTKGDALVTTLYCPKNGKPFQAPRQLSMLSEGGIKRFIFLRNAMISFQRKQGGKHDYVFEQHVDRYAGLCEARDGNLHLVLDPLYPFGYGFGEEGRAKKRAEELLLMIEGQCSEAGVVLHVPEKPFKVPLAIGFAQLVDGTVIMTPGEEQLDRIINSLLPPEKIIKPSPPFQHIPCWSKAGIRCWMAELPRCFLNMLAP